MGVLLFYAVFFSFGILCELQSYYCVIHSHCLIIDLLYPLIHLLLLLIGYLISPSPPTPFDCFSCISPSPFPLSFPFFLYPFILPLKLFFVIILISIDFSSFHQNYFTIHSHVSTFLNIPTFYLFPPSQPYIVPRILFIYGVKVIEQQCFYFAFTIIALCITHLTCKTVLLSILTLLLY